MIVALSADIDIGIVLTEQRAGGGDEVVVGGESRIEKLSRMTRVLVGVMARGADYGNVGISERQWFSFEEALAYRAGVASTTGIDLIGRVEILDDARVCAGMPLVVGGRMATAANGTGQLNSRPHSGVIGISGVIAGRTVAILALDTSELRGCGRTDEAGGKPIAHGMTGQALRVFILFLIYQCGESLSVRGQEQIVVGLLMAFGAVLGTGVLRSWSLDLENRVTLGDSHRRSPGKIGWTTHGLPFRLCQTFLE